MNEHMRRLLAEAADAAADALWDDHDPRDQRFNDKPAKRALAQTRRQQEKQRGKVIARHLRAISQQRRNGKP
jgi:hypothetical protein